MSRTVEVAVPVPLRRVFHYAVPPDLAERAQVGCRVRVRFGRRMMVGYVVARDTPAPPDVRLASVHAVLDDVPVFSAAVLGFVRWLADYYHAPLGEALRGAHPAGTNEGGVPGLASTAAGRAALAAGGLDPEASAVLRALPDDEPRPRTALTLPGATTLKAWIEAGWVLRATVLTPPPVQVRRVRMVSAAAPAPLEARGPGGRPLKRDLIHTWLVGRGSVPTRAVNAEFGNAATHLRALEAEGAIRVEMVEVVRDPFFGEEVARDQPPTLTSDQRQAVAAIGAGEGYRGFLLQGITGSGKTEVYLHAIEAVLAAGAGALVLVPEIALTPQLVRRFRARLGDAIAVLHSGLSPGARFDQWRRLRRGEVRVAIGARSAVFAPVDRLALIVVDEEHDPSFKQHDGVRYQARDMALVRGAREGAAVVLGSATPSLESAHNVARGKLTRLLLASRPTGGTLPRVELVDLRVHRALDEARFLSPPLRDALTATLARREQAILFLNRRGFSTYVLCQRCGHVLECPECAISLTWHRRRQRLVCHYSDYQRSLPERCSECGTQGSIALFGQGTERVEAALADLYPEARVARMDRDTASGRTLQALVGRMRRREIDILVGTQMVTKGHDFPSVTLVGVLAADASLQFPDFRAGERTFQLLTQVAGRAGRGTAPGQVFVQTYNPDHPVIQAVQTHDYAVFSQQALTDRKLAGYPPFTHALCVRLSSEDPGAAAGFAERLGAVLRQAGAGSGPPLHLRGPAPMPIAVLRNRHRWSMLVTAAQRPPLHRLAAAVQAVKVPNGLRVIVDVDPYDFL